ncbi:Aldo-keto reductase family 1 member [Wickerhamomyces ciferrii]|uniref:Aldo-keto reductase family 1 member n=1 Tax=Wickerhamomyces ciferrii (strain ATCC 14091 / BCRC 22168 / CBS 111 / JCM 3599 / NBRC 0793 / NRRL Y-1031 F-60-10) TaxID=1206466 RepID=K0KUI0_WICCF|nr:Aldo-keto reductase family 1 member [Wickerhamomyces ciferrii]CCH44848.1 Aldo-keto reductase family 1 member [Wickerhamomyces ciferrii]
MVFANSTDLMVFNDLYQLNKIIQSINQLHNMSAQEIINEINKVKFGLGLMSFTWRPDPYPQSSFNESVLAAIEKNLPNKTFVNGGEFYGADYLNLRYIQSFLETYPEQRENLIISIKGSVDLANLRPLGDRENLNKSIDKVLEFIPDLDIFEIPRIDPTVTLEETITTLNDAVDNGKIKAISVSEVNATTLGKIAQISKHPIAVVEIEFSIFSRDILENGLAAKAGELGIPIVAYSPLSRGLLTGEIKDLSKIPKGDIRLHFDRFKEENFIKNQQIVEFITQAAKEKNVTPAQFSLAWIRYQSGKTIDEIKLPKIIDIPSTSSAKRVQENFSNVVLTDDEFNKVQSFIKNVTVHGVFELINNKPTSKYFFKMAGYSIYLRVIIFSFIIYKLIQDPRELGRQISSYTVSYTPNNPSYRLLTTPPKQKSKIIFTESESSLFATLLIILGLSDYLPYLEDNQDYFDSIVPVRFLLGLGLTLGSYLELVSILSSPLVFWFGVLEILTNGLMLIDV